MPDIPARITGPALRGGKSAGKLRRERAEQEAEMRRRRLERAGKRFSHRRRTARGHARANGAPVTSLDTPTDRQPGRPAGRPRKVIPPHAPTTQADRIVEAFGGVMGLVRALKAYALAHNKPEAARNPASVYRWTYAYPRGFGGLVPLDALEWIIRAAPMAGVVLTDEMLSTNVLVRQRKERSR